MGWMAPAPGVAAPRWCCHAARAWSPTMEITTVGLDLAKNVFQVHAIGSTGGVVVRRSLRRAQVIRFFSKLPPCLIGMEACGTSDHWARELVGLGHEVRLMPPAYVKPYVKRGSTASTPGMASPMMSREPFPSRGPPTVISDPARDSLQAVPRSPRAQQCNGTPYF